MAGRVAAIFDASQPCSPLSVPNAKTALLLLDYQVLVLAHVSDEQTRAKILQAAQDVRFWALSQGMTVYHCLVDIRPGVEPLPISKFAQRWETIHKPRIVGNPGLGNIVDELNPSDAEHEKTTARRPGMLSALSAQDLVDDLKVRGIRSLIMGGLSTSNVLLSTARMATDQGFVTTVVEDVCWDPVPGLHDMLMQHVLPSSAHVATLKGIQQAWTEKGSGK